MWADQLKQLMQNRVSRMAAVIPFWIGVIICVFSVLGWIVLILLAVGAEVKNSEPPGGGALFGILATIVWLLGCALIVFWIVAGIYMLDVAIHDGTMLLS
jgi:hypothetical protein